MGVAGCFAVVVRRVLCPVHSRKIAYLGGIDGCDGFFGRAKDC